MPLSIINQATKRAAESMNTNNISRSRVSDQLFSLLESGEGSTEIRDLLDQTLHNFANTQVIGSPTYQWDNLRKCASIKEKIAYLAACHYEQNDAIPGGVNTQNDIVNDTQLQTRLDDVTQFLECELISNRDFTESWMLRHAAFTTFAAGLTPKETTLLNTLASDIRKLCEDSSFENLAQSTHFTKESDAQKIMKLGQIIKELSGQGVKISDAILTQIEPLDKKIEPLKKLDVSYKHLGNMLNMVHSLPAGYPPMIDQKKQTKLISILGKLGKKQEDFILTPRETTKSDEYVTLKEKYADLANHPDIQKIMEEEGIQPDTLMERFLVYFTYRNSEKAKRDLDAQKKKTFGGKEKDYEQGHQQWRGRLRNRIFEIGSRMVAGPNVGTIRVDNLVGGERATFATPQDFQLANSYFSKFQNLFFVDERDAYEDGRDNRNMQNKNRPGALAPIENHFLTMRNTVAAILRERCPTLATGRPVMSGSVFKKMIDWLEHTLHGKTLKGVFKMIKRTYHNADHAEILAMVIMLNNQAQQQMFHGQKDPFDHRNGFFGKMFNGMNFAEKKRKEVGKKIAPYANKFLGFIETSIKTVARPIVNGAEKFRENRKASKRYNPKNILLPFAWTIAKGKDAYHGVQEYLSKLKGEQVTQISSALVDVTDAVTGMVGKTVSYAGEVAYDHYKTNQQRSVLSTFFDLASQDEQRRPVLESGELSEVLNFQNRETYLFDEDGRVDMVDKKEECKEIKAGKELAKAIKDQIALLQKGLDDKKDNLDRLITEAMRANNGSERRFDDALQRLEMRTTDIMTVRTALERLLPLLKDPVTNAAAIQAIVVALSGLLTAVGGPLTVVTERINRINNIPPGNPDSREIQQTAVNTANAGIIAEDAIIRANTANDPVSRAARVAAEGARANHINNKNQAAQQLADLSQELRELGTWRSWLQRVDSLCTTINANPADEDTIKSLANSLDLILYKPASAPVVPAPAPAPVTP